MRFRDRLSIPTKLSQLAEFVDVSGVFGELDSQFDTTLSIGNHLTLKFRHSIRIRYPIQQSQVLDEQRSGFEIPMIIGQYALKQLDSLLGLVARICYPRSDECCAIAVYIFVNLQVKSLHMQGLDLQALFNFLLRLP
ncbi:MAG: hypothetical protein B7Z55_17940 [Planctomycetales bacterium 12-60-4]|nr:MAG: hypothetical protein B7Z55_17940 [Planctomycetales bacterium 12-60-4]